MEPYKAGRHQEYRRCAALHNIKSPGPYRLPLPWSSKDLRTNEPSAPSWALYHNHSMEDHQRSDPKWTKLLNSVEWTARHQSENSTTASIYEASFGVIGPKLWNTLPRAISTITTKTTFKTRLTKYLSQFPDLPPVDGFASRNSLLDFNRLDLPGGRSLFSADEDWDDLHHWRRMGTY